MDITETHEHTNRCWWNLHEARWECAPPVEEPPPLEEPPPVEEPLTDVRDMVVVHTALLREFRLAPAAVARTAPGDRRQAGTVAQHLTFLCDLLHHHHTGEDELLWPTLRARTARGGPRAARLLDDADAQHRDLDAALDDVRGLLAAWVADAAPEPGERLAAALEKVHALLRDHLEFEERALLPLAAAHLRTDEWDAVGEAAVAALPKPALALAFGMFAYEGDPEVLRGMLASAPAVPRALLPRIAPRLYARRARRVYGTPRP